MKPNRQRGGRPYGSVQTFVHILLAATLTMAALPHAAAQTNFGNIQITVVDRDDPSAVIPRVFVVLRGGRGRELTCQTDEKGQCSFETVNPGVYEVRVGRPEGPAPTSKMRATRVSVYAGRTVSRTIRISVALGDEVADPEDVTRKAVQELPEEGWLSDRTNPQRPGTSGTEKTLEDLPNRGAEISTLFNTQPGTLFTEGSSFGGVSINGQPGSENRVLLDGFDTTPQVLAPSSFQDTNAFLIFDPGKRQGFKELDAFSLDLNNTPAMLGTGTGGKLLKSIKAGSTTHAGEVYWFNVPDALSARNFFDPAEKPSLNFNLFGAKLGGPLNFRPDDTPKFFYFVNYEGIRARSGNTLFEAVPSEAARARAVAPMTTLLGGYFAGGARLVPNASADPDFDILHLDTENEAERNSITVRFDFTPQGTKRKDGSTLLHAFAFLYTRAHAREDTPEGVTGRRQLNRGVEQNALFKYTRTSGGGERTNAFTNELLVGFNQTPTRLGARSPFTVGVGLVESAVGVGGKVTRLDGGLPVPVATLGGLLRDNSRFKGRGLLTSPSRLSLIDQLVWNRTGGHTFTFGGELRVIRAEINQLFGTTYNFTNLAGLLANAPATVQFSGDLGSFTAAEGTGAVGAREAAQEYYIGFAQHEWQKSRNLRLTYGLRYEYFSPLREKDDRVVLFDVNTGKLLPSSAPLHRASRNGFLPRVAVSWVPSSQPKDAKDFNLNTTIISASFGAHASPGIFTDLTKPIESDRFQVTREGGLFPLAPAVFAAAFTGNVNDRRFQPLALARDYTTPVRVYKYDVSVKHDLIKRSVAKELFLTATYAGNRSRNLLLRNFSNRILSVETAPDPTKPAIVTREFDIPRGAGLEPFRPFGEIEYRTSGGRSSYDSLQLSAKGRWETLKLTLFDVQYTLAGVRGNTNGAEKTAPAGNTFDYDYDVGYHIDDVRHTFSVTTVFELPCPKLDWCRGAEASRFKRYLFGNWSIGSILNLQSGRPVDVRLTRPDVVYLDAQGRVFNSPASGRRAVINVPGGGNSLDARRPHLVPGVSPYINGDRRFLNPAAFAIPAPGTFGNLTRGAIRAPSLKFFDLSLRKEFKSNDDTPRHVFTFRVDITNLFNMTNFDRPTAKLADALGTGDNQLQPGQPFSATAAGDFGILNRTFKREADLGASRQIQFGLSFKF